MADNYIEKQYEEYEARKAAWLKAKKHAAKATTPESLTKAKQPEEGSDGIKEESRVTNEEAKLKE